MNRSRRYLFVLVLIIAGLACNIPTREPVQPSITQPPPPVAPTAVDIATLAPTPPPEPTTPPQPTDPPPEPTVPPPAANPYVPAGFIVIPGDGSSVVLYDSQGGTIGTVSTPGMSTGGEYFIHVAGGVPGSELDVPVVFHTYENLGILKHNLAGQITILVEGPEVSSLCGAVGEPVLAYSVVTWNEHTETLDSRLYAGRLGVLAKTSPILEFADPKYRAVLPLAVEAVDGRPEGIWYTMQPWGIGGDIVFPPHDGLYYLDLPSGETRMILADELFPTSLSSDQSWTAYSYLQEGGKPVFSLYNLETSEEVDLPLVPSSDRGAGYAVFSPDNQFVAWMEGAGWQMAEVPNFTSRVRIGNTSGDVFADLIDTVLATVTPTKNAHWVKPRGWLDTETLIVEVRGVDWSQVSLVRVKYDGSGLTLLAPGAFAGFYYP